MRVWQLLAISLHVAQVKLFFFTVEAALRNALVMSSKCAACLLQLLEEIPAAAARNTTCERALPL
jgi:hypothetical protein